MNRIQRYLFRQLMLSVVFACLAITLVVWFSQSIRLLTLVINNGASLWDFLRLMLLILPTFLPLILPLSLMVGALFIYHRLIMESELHVMQAVGMSPLALARPSLMTGIIVGAAGYFLTLVVAPWANHELVRLQYQIRNDHSVLLLRTGSFHDVAKGLTFYARDRGRQGEMRGILIHDTRTKTRPVTIMAESGELVRDKAGPSIMVRNGMRQDVDSSSGVLSQLTFDKYLVNLSNADDSFSTRWRDPRERSITELLNPQGTDQEPQTRARFIAEIHLRMAMPFLSVTFVLIACTFVLTGSYERRGIARKIIMAAFTVVMIEIIMLTIFNMLSKEPWLAVLLYLTAFVPVPFLLQRLRAGDSLPGPSPTLAFPPRAA
jgi:lipopolysaccharide export system permease protein